MPAGRGVRRALVCLGLCLAVTVVLHPVGEGQEQRPVMAGAETQPAAPAVDGRADRRRREVVAAAAVLRDWDRRRAAAYSRGDAGALRRLYASGCPAAARDVRRLRAYAERGLVVRGMQMQLIEVELLRHTERLVRLQVEDRLVGAVVASVDAGSPVEARLPADLPSTRAVTLVRRRGEWRALVVASPRSAVRSCSGPATTEQTCTRRLRSAARRPAGR